MRYKLGEVIALSRLVLASVFLLAIYLDPSVPTAAPVETYVLLSLYVLIALGLLVATRRNWWLDHHLARPALWLDLAVFAAVVFTTEGYTSPFFTFSLFLLLSAAVRWGRRETTRMALAVNLVFLLSGLAAALYTPGDVDLQRILIRASYLAVLSLLFIWYSRSSQEKARQVLRASPDGTFEPARVVELIVENVGARMSSDHLICVWREPGHETVHACSREGGSHMTLEVAQDELAEVLNRVPDTPFLFDTGKGRLLVRSRTKVVAMRCPAKVARFLERRGVGEGLGITVRTAGLECAVVAAGAVSVDDLATGAQLTEDVAFMHEQATVNRLTQETAAARTRLAVARDLHDSVAQLLAGISFRLEALKRSRKPAAELSRELETLQRELTTEQEQVRSLIAELRQPAEAPFAGNLPSRLGDLTDRLARQWGIDCAFEHDGKVPSEASFDKELQQMVREGVANAVRHGRADRVAIRLRAALGGYELLIADNGHGWPNGKDGAGLATPRSLHERAEALGGSLEAGQDRNGATVRILLPAEAAR